ncbi:TPA: Bug family tripartite tricarboxylate transporter substrate binding protein [Pseudomonas aeruginosa]|nr:MULTISPECIES: tripartite tricarboxylate transporter substrate binding protein [Gammaproteobacteria]MBS3184357.1 tripartite tricarboxylate transporter substrate binding protein [Pseudomonas sp. PCH44]MCB2255537.1 tripartite tricarboxylate transporter substrate binding protein [Pseudomonas chlororaphis]HCL2787033.1 tripartite tricarboxylate transporter substrate binding protein [Pseudomonas aeruginosa 1BAE]HDS0938040.1 tripartite tricarboxylate transporter substrate binding protein [Pseudomona
MPRTMMSRRQIALAAFISPLLLSTSASFGADIYPSRPIKIIVPIAAGGANDATARALALDLQKKLGVPVIIDNRPGGNFVIGTGAAASAPPDGYTLGWALSAALSLNPLLYDSLPYKPNDVEYIAAISKSYQVIAVPGNAKANTLKEWIAEVKKSDGPAAIGVSSFGGTVHLMAEDLGDRAGFRVEPVVFRGEAPASVDLAAGQLPAMSGILANLLEYHRVGRVKILAISSESRLPLIPDVPTFIELGYPISAVYWNGVFAPKGTPKSIVARLSEAIREIVETPEFRARLAAIPDVNYINGSSDVMKALVKADQDYYGRIITKRKISLKN